VSESAIKSVKRPLLFIALTLNVHVSPRGTATLKAVAVIGGFVKSVSNPVNPPNTSYRTALSPPVDATAVQLILIVPFTGAPMSVLWITALASKTG
jgi:hypothetical protein